jgi:hypothetical protein
MLCVQAKIGFNFAKGFFSFMAAFYRITVTMPQSSGRVLRQKILKNV